MFHYTCFIQQEYAGFTPLLSSPSGNREHTYGRMAFHH